MYMSKEKGMSNIVVRNALCAVRKGNFKISFSLILILFAAKLYRQMEMKSSKAIPSSSRLKTEGHLLSAE